MLTATERIGSGVTATFFRVDKYAHLGAKVVYDTKEGLDLRREEAILRMLRNHDIPVPRPAGITKVYIPESLEPGISRIFGTRKCLVMELFELAYFNHLSQNQKNHISLIQEKIESLGIVVFSDFNDNLLYCPRTKTIVVSDFHMWEFPESLEKEIYSEMPTRNVFKKLFPVFS